MDIRKTLLKQYTKHDITKLVDYLSINNNELKQLINIYKLGPYRITQRAAWILGLLGERNPNSLEPFLTEIIAFTSDTHNAAVKRNTMRLLQFVDIPQKLKSKVVEMGFQFLNDRREAIAVKVFSMSVLVKLAHQEPGLVRELRFVIEDQLPFSGPAFTSRARKELRRLIAIVGSKT